MPLHCLRESADGDAPADRGLAMSEPGSAGPADVSFMASYGGPLGDVRGQRLQFLLEVAGCAVETERPGGKAGAEVADVDLLGWCGAVMLAVDEHALRQVEGAGVGEDLVVVGFAAEPAAGDFVLAVGDVGGQAGVAVEREVGLDPYVPGIVEVVWLLRADVQLPVQVTG